MATTTKIDFEKVTEVPGRRASAEQLRMLFTRYHLAAKYAEGKDVLEVACGAGIGLGFLARRARRMVGGDIDASNLAYARRTYQDRENIEIRQLDALDLPFNDNSFDTVLLYEAIYYLPDPERFVAEARRVLRFDGTLLIVTANPSWDGFNPSPFSHRYFSATQLFQLLREGGFHPQLLAGFPDDGHSLKSKLVGTLRRIAVHLHLFPKTMKGKEWLKRMFYGRLEPLAAELSENGIQPADLIPIEPIQHPSIGKFKVLYSVGTVIK